MSIIGLISIGIIADFLALVAVLWFGSQASDREGSRDKDTVGQALTPEGVAEAVRCLGYVPVMQDDHVEFRISGQPYRISTKDLPVLKIETSFLLDGDNLDYRLLLDATTSVSIEKQHLIDFFPSRREEGFRIFSSISAFEPDRICFRESLIYYVNLIAETEREVCDCYNDLIDKKELEESYLNWVDKDALSRKRPS